MNPNTARRLRRKRAEAKLAAEVHGMSDEELLRQIQREVSGEAEAERQRAAADPAFGHLSDEELIALHERLLTEERAAEAERQRRMPESGPAEPIISEPPVEPHPVALDPEPEPKVVEPPETPRQKWEREQHESTTRAIARELAAGEAEHETTQRMKDTGTYDGPMLGEMLRLNGGG